LAPSAVNTNTFGLLWSYAVDGYVYTQPLYVPNVNIPGQGTHNVIYIGTENDSVYALDADSNTGTNGGVLWHTNLGIAALSNNGEFGNRYGPTYGDIVPEVGITGTPVIDPVSGTIYVDVFTREIGATSTNYYHRIHALNITNGVEQPGSPVVIAATYPGTGVGGNGSVLTFDPKEHNERSALTLAGGVLYVGYAGYGDTDPYHGWLFGVSTTNLQILPKYIFNTTPNATMADFGTHAGEGGMWMGGNGLCVDGSNNLYFESGNGSFSANTNGGDYADSFLKLNTSNGLSVADYFTPYDQANDAAADLDVGSAGPLLLPDSAGSAAHPHLIVGGSKEGTIYLLDRDNLGHYSTSGSDNQVVQSVVGQMGGAWSSPAYFNNQLYFQASGDVLKAFAITNGVLGTTPSSKSAASVGAFNGGPVVSANGTNDGIVWMLNSSAFASSGPEILYAYSATNLADVLYNSSQLPRDNPGGAVKMVNPMVANGKVYVGAEYALSIFGYNSFLATPTISPDGLAFTNSVTVTLSDSTPGVSIYYTEDGNIPTTNSTLYTAPFLVTSTLNLQAVAVKAGAINSGVASASFINTAALGDGTGLLGEYWANTTGARFTNVDFATLPTLTRTDAVVNFNWSNAGPAPSVGQTNFIARWTGSLQPEYSETYNLTTVASGGVLVWVNGHLLINSWPNSLTSVTNSAAISLKAQELYTIQMDYSQSNGNAGAQLFWSSPSTSQAIIPQTQLYPYTNPPPVVVLTAPTNGSTFTAIATVSLTADADATYNAVSSVNFYTNNVYLGTASNPPYALTTTGWPAGGYTLTAIATDGSGLTTTSSPVSITIAAGSGLAYGLTTNGTVGPFLNQNMPGDFSGSIPPLLSETGAFSDTPNRVPAAGLIPYVPNTPLWSDNAVKSRYMAVPDNAGLTAPAQQIGFAPTGSWTFPGGTVFVKNFDLVVNQTNPAVPVRRLETRLLVRDTNGAVYGVTYKWLPDNSDAELLSGSLSEAVLVTNATGVETQNWYYPSPADCLTCHTEVAGYVLGVNTRQLNGSNTYPATGVTDNQLRTFNRLGLFYPAFNEAYITNFDQLVNVTNLNAPIVQRVRSYLDANCAQCHQPGGTGISFDARYDTPLTNQNLINYPAALSLGYDHAKIIAPNDVWRSVIYDRMNTVDPTIKMPPLDRNLVDSNAVATLVAWVNSMGATPALAPPLLTPAPGVFTNEVMLSLTSPDSNAAIYYTLDGTLPTTNSILYSGPFNLDSFGTTTVMANAFEANYVNSVAVIGLFNIVPPLNQLFAPELLADGSFQVNYWGSTGQTYVLQTSTNLLDWISINTNTPAFEPFTLVDPGASGVPYRFYRVISP
ncbi:MAG: chitobiase/beta-hexosaminidase C-terminal domain-containing protein, partial [Verrucomicrobiota bacterium]